MWPWPHNQMQMIWVFNKLPAQQRLFFELIYKLETILETFDLLKVTPRGEPLMNRSLPIFVYC